MSMRQLFAVEVEAAATSSTRAVSESWTRAENLVQAIECELKKGDKANACQLTVRVYDPDWAIFNALPHPNKAKIKVRLKLARPGDTLAAGQVVFDGIAMSLQPGYPGPTQLTIIAHDQSIEARRVSKYRTFRNLNSLQIADKVFKEYGLLLDTSELPALGLKNRAVDIAASTVGRGFFSEWDQIVRALAVDGLRPVVKGSKVRIVAAPSKDYAETFRKNEPNIIRLDAQLNRGGTGTAHIKTPAPAGSVGQLSGAGEANKQMDAAAKQAESTTHRVPVGGTQATDGAHSEAALMPRFSEDVERHGDEATLQVTSTPDLDLHHRVQLSGWGAKVDGAWTVESLRHVIAGEVGTSTIRLSRGKATGSSTKATAVAPAASSAK